MPAFLSSRRMLRAATGLAWAATGVLLLWGLEVALMNRDAAVPFYPLPAAIASVLAIGCHARLRFKGGRLLRT